MTNEEMAAQLKAQTALVEKMAKQLEEQSSELAKLKASTEPAPEAKKEKPSTPEKVLTVEKKKYVFNTPKFRIQVGSTFKTFISSEELENKELHALIVKKGYTNILKPVK